MNIERQIIKRLSALEAEISDLKGLLADTQVIDVRDITVAETAVILGCSEDTVRKAIAEGQFKTAHKGKRRWWISLQEVIGMAGPMYKAIQKKTPTSNLDFKPYAEESI